VVGIAAVIFLFILRAVFNYLCISDLCVVFVGVALTVARRTVGVLEEVRALK
jgi:hypothetical protein